ncbi:MAG: hypothetical protein U0930_15045 [Pirellulales bacterium]
MLTGVSLTCFLFSYLLVLLLEVWRLFFKLPARQVLILLGMIAGLLAHTIFLGNELFGDQSGRVLSNWFQWVVLGAWGLAIACTYLMARNPTGNIGLFLLPLVLLLIGVATLVRGIEPFAKGSAVTFWGQVHGVSLLLGTMFIFQGLAFGLMYLVQSTRLKNKSKKRAFFRLPALEFLQSINRMTLFASAIALGVGMLSGVMLNLARGGVSWIGSGTIVSFALFLWSALAAFLESRASRALGGRRGAFLSIASFVFLVVVLVSVILSSHGQKEPSSKDEKTDNSPSHSDAVSPTANFTDDSTNDASSIHIDRGAN